MPGQKWTPDASGGFLANDTLSKKVRHQAQPMMRFRQFVRKEPGFGKNKGDTILFDRISNVATGGGTISELNKMPEDSVTISQGSVTVAEYGNSVPWTGKLEALAEFSVDNIVMKALKNDMAKTLDAAVGAEFQTAKIKAVPTGTDAAPTTAFETTLATSATRHTQVADIKNVIDAMKSTYTIPPFDGENYVCICSVGFARTIKDDPDFEDAAKYGDPERLFSGEIGRYYGCRFIEETNVLSNAPGGTYKGEAIFFGDDPIVEGIAVPEEIRSKIPTDYGRDRGLAWYFLGNWGLTYDTSTAGEAKIIHLTSA